MAGARPAARLTDPHVCPAVTGIVPHVGGPIIPPCCVTVLINKLPAARITDLLTCIGPPDVIVEGSPSVLIGKLPASRIFDSCVHGGKIILGSLNVWIGTGAAGGTATISAAAARAVLGARGFPGQQNFNNCGIQSAAQIIFFATGRQQNENVILAVALASGNASGGTPPGGTTPAQRRAILAANGVPSTVVPTTQAALGTAIGNGQGVIVNVDAGTWWGNPAQVGSGHAVTVTGGTFDNAGNLQTVTVNDTGNGTTSTVPAATLMQAANARPGGSSMNVTDNPIFTP
jgi:uncharacterized Zn-binding protein involved in type VI secretion